MAIDYFKETKSRLESAIPEFESKNFHEMEEKIRRELQNKENEFLLQVRSLRVLVLGDWHTDAKKQALYGVRDALLRHGYYAQTVDVYYDIDKKSGLPAQKIFEICCIRHQLIVFVDGEGKGKVTEQEYLRQNYGFQGKLLFFIDTSKFAAMGKNPKEYFRIFPSIVEYSANELNEKVLTYVALRLYRLAEIIEIQEGLGRGLKGPHYQPWHKRLDTR